MKKELSCSPHSPAAVRQTHTTRSSNITLNTALIKHQNTANIPLNRGLNVSSNGDSVREANGVPLAVM